MTASLFEYLKALGVELINITGESAAVALDAERSKLSGHFGCFQSVIRPGFVPEYFINPEQTHLLIVFFRHNNPRTRKNNPILNIIYI